MASSYSGSESRSYSHSPAVQPGLRDHVLWKTNYSDSTQNALISAKIHYFLPLILLLSPCIGAQTGAVRFAPPVTIPVAAQWVATGDLNSDGKADIVAAGGNAVFVALGNGDGTFRNPSSYSLGNLGLSSVIAVAVGDLNGDSKPDVIVATGLIGSDGGNVVLLLGNGDGTLQAPSSIATGISPMSVLLADLNHDQKLDVVIGGNGSARLMLGKGDGTFQPLQRVDCCASLPTGFYSLAHVAVGDINHDGNVDLVFGGVGSGGPPLLAFLGNGDGTFQPPTSSIPLPLQPGTIGSVGSVALVDLNLDGSLDIVADESSSNTMGVLINNGDGTFKPAVIYYAGSTPTQLITGDFNHDGNVDVAIADFNNSQFGPNDGMGVTVISGGGDGALSETSETQWEANVQSESVATADFNGDGFPDLVTADGHNITVLINAPNGPPLPIAVLSVTSLSFPGTTVVGGSSAPLPVKLKNWGYAPLAISSITSSRDFSQSNNCPAQLAINASCTINVTFTPTSAGTRNGLLSIAQNSGVSPVTVSLTGTAIASYPSPTLTTLSPTGMVLGITGAQTVKLTGTNFFVESKVLWNGTPVTTQFVNGTTLQIQLSTQDLANVGDVLISVVNPAPAAPSAAIHFVIYRSVPLSARALLFDAKRNRLYASIDAAASAYASYIVSIDPNTGTVTPLVSAGGEPGVLALTSDAQFLYAGVDGTGSVIRVNLDTGTVDETISLGSDPRFGAYSAQDVAVLPGAPNSLAVLKISNGSPNFVMTIYDGTTARASVTGPLGASLNSILFFPDSTQLFGSGQYDFIRYSVDANGITEKDRLSGVGRGGLVTDGSVLYVTDPVRAIDASTMQVIGSFAFFGGGAASAVPDKQTGKMYTLTYGYAPNSTSLQDTQIYSADPNSFAQLDELEVPVGGRFQGGLVRWGTDGLAFRSYAGSINVGGADPSDQVVIFRSSLVSPLPRLTVSVGAVSFDQIVVGQSALAPSPVVITNNSGAVVNISSIASSGDFSQTNDCGSSVTPGQACRIQVTFRPMAVGTRTGTLTITASDSSVAHAVSLSGTGIAPGIVTVSVANLIFAPQIVNSSSTAQSFTITNTGGQPISIASVAANGDFSQSNDCASLAAGQKCTVTVTFKPSKTGTLSGNISVSYGAGGSPQVVQLSGVGADFTVAASSGSQTTSTVQAGATAVYKLNLTPTTAIPGPVSLACSGAPANATCTVSPVQLDLSSGSAQGFTVTVNTTGPGHAELVPSGTETQIVMALLPLGVLLLGRTHKKLRKEVLRRVSRAGSLLAVVAFSCLHIGCGGAGGGSSSPTPSSSTNNFTASGTYTLTITANEGSVTRNMNLTLQVQ
jgi:hypothetical protein